jgi:dTDP-4-dehydrorhamnose 3,5-epimerase
MGMHGTLRQDNLSHAKKRRVARTVFPGPVSTREIDHRHPGQYVDVAVDVRQGSLNFGKWVGFEFGTASGDVVWIPEGFANGFIVLSDVADIVYKVTNFWAPEAEHIIRWNDPVTGIDWPIADPILRYKDAQAPCLDAVCILAQYRP